jgi:hypothetical protein
MAREEGPEDEVKPEACAKKRSDNFFFLSVARKACGEAEDEGAAGACDGTRGRTLGRGETRSLR